MTSPDKPQPIQTDCIFMIEPGYIEWQAILLASSLMEHTVNRGDIVAYCRKSRVDDLSPLSTAFLARHGIELRTIQNDFSPEYPQGNKTIACAAHTSSNGVVFFDTDMMVLRKANFSKIIKPGEVSVCTAKKKWPEAGDAKQAWTNNYELCGVPFDYDAELIDDKVPYFNGGLIAYYGPDNFGPNWLDVALTLDKAEIVFRRPWLDQVAMPVAIKKSGLAFRVVPRIWNRGLNNNLRLSKKTIVGHYHRLRRIKQHELVKPANKLLQKYSDFPDLKTLIQTIHPADDYVKS